MFTPMLHLGTRVSAPPGTDARFLVPPEVLLRHAVFLGASGSGKTVASKVLVEEMLRSGVPSIVVDPQGDLASLALPGDAAELARHGVPDEIAREVHARAEVVIWTPGSEAGIPLGLSPLTLAELPEESDARTETIGLAARAVVSLVGMNLEKEDGKSAEAAVVLCLEDAHARGDDVRGFEGLARVLTEPTAALAARLDGVSDGALRDGLAKKLRRSLVGSTGKLFDRGVPLDIDVLLGRDERLLGPAGAKGAYAKTRCSVIYLNSLPSQEEKEFFVAELVRTLTRWMLQHPSEKVQCLFFIDEIAPFLPPVRKPACRDALRLLVKQARKYGVACAFATQNPGDIDYKSLAQCSTWGLGRMTLKQDLKKLSAFLKGIAPAHAEKIEEMLPARPAGELLFLAPDVAQDVVTVKTRWLATVHKTLDLDDVKAATTPEQRALFAALAVRLRGREDGSSPTPPPPRVAHEPTPSPPGEKEKPEKPRSSSSQEKRRAAESEDDDRSLEDQEAAPSDLEQLKPRLAELLEKEMAALTAEEVVALVRDAPAGRTRRALRELAEVEAIRRDRCGRSFVHWHPRHSFDLERRKLRPVLVAEARVLEGDALSRAHAFTRSRLIFFDAETVSGLALKHLPLHRVRVRAQREKGLFLKETVKVESTLYLHPKDARVLELSRGELRFVQAPREKAEDVQDLDQVVTGFARSSPGALAIRPEHEPTLETAEVEAAIKRKFAVDEVLSVDIVHLPFWEFDLVDTKSKKRRSGGLDALLGAPFDPEAASPST
ncbi:DUF853 family protein [bacterium]|nr:DUF853 family protein [bacterium]